MSDALNLLLVDGHAGVRTALADRLRLLSAVGAVAVAATVEAAVALARDQAPDVVLYDPRTVEGDATEAVRRLGQSGCPVVVFTSSLRGGEDTALARAGAADIVFKGMEVGALLDRLQDVLIRHNASPPGAPAP